MAETITNMVSSIQRLKYLIYFLYSALLIYLVFIRGDDHRHFHILSPYNHFNIVPAKEKVLFFTSGTIWGGGHFKFFLKELFGNLLLFVPLSFCLMLGEGMTNSKKVLQLAFASSLFIEVTQFVLGIGTADIDDVVLNTLGAGLGVVLVNRIKQGRFGLLFR